MSPVLLAVAGYLIALPIVLVFMVALGRAARYADEIENRNRRAAARDRDGRGTPPSPSSQFGQEPRVAPMRRYDMRRRYARRHGVAKVHVIKR